VATSITDYGLCTTINGNPMDATYEASAKMDVFKQYLDRRPKDNYVPLNVSGSGTSHTTRKVIEFAGKFKFMAGNVFFSISLCISLWHALSKCDYDALIGY
jgi:hypothetical protein